MGHSGPFPIIEHRITCGVRTVWIEFRADEQIVCWLQSYPGANPEHISYADFWENARRIVSKDLSSPSAFEQLEVLDKLKELIDGRIGNTEQV